MNMEPVTEHKTIDVESKVKLDVKPESAPCAPSVDRFNLGRVLGTGAFSVVNSATHIPTSREVAVKVMERAKIRKLGAEVRVRYEIEGLRKCASHPHIVRMYRACEDPASIMLAFEHAGGGDMYDYMTSKKGNCLGKNEARRFFQQLASAVRYMHSKLVCHRDLKVDNLLLDNARENIKLADFGFCRRLSSQDQKTVTPCGSPHYCAPEILEAPKESYFGLPVDIWSMGVILFGMITGTLPFNEPTHKEMFKKVKAGDFSLPYVLDKEERDIISRMLTVNVVKRIGSEGIHRHPYFCKKAPRYLTEPPESFEVSKRGMDKDVVAKVVKLYEKVEDKEKEVTADYVKLAAELSREVTDRVTIDGDTATKTISDSLIDTRCAYEILLDAKDMNEKWDTEETNEKGKKEKSKGSFSKLFKKKK
mmetsp:Transcript_10211/g.21507  ORF Transcript_10211/g.21507 Transcript_10211/m.21507 type:complete len:420 (-) Transcript_10211:122-1381(-)